MQFLMYIKTTEKQQMTGEKKGELGIEEWKENKKQNI